MVIFKQSIPISMQWLALLVFKGEKCCNKRTPKTFIGIFILGYRFIVFFYNTEGIKGLAYLDNFDEVEIRQAQIWQFSLRAEFLIEMLPIENKDILGEFYCLWILTLLSKTVNYLLGSKYRPLK